MNSDSLSADPYKEFVRHFTQEARRIFAYILTLAGNYDDASEIFQETSGALWEKFSEFEPGTNFGAWACRVAYYKALNHRAAKKKSPVLFSELLLESFDSEWASHAEQVDHRQRALIDCYDLLSEADRELIRRKYVVGNNAERIAQALGQSRASVYRALARVHERLMVCISSKLGDEGERA